MGLFNHAGHQKPGHINLDEATPDEVLEHMMKVGRWANGSEVPINDFFTFEGSAKTFEGTGNFWNFKNVSYEFYAIKGGFLDFSTFIVNVGTVDIVLDATIINGSDGSIIKNSTKVVTSNDQGDFSQQTYFINVTSNDDLGHFYWTAYNFFNGTPSNPVRSTIQGNRLAGYLTYQFTGRYRTETEYIP